MQGLDLMRKYIIYQFLQNFYEKNLKKHIDSKIRLVYTNP